MERIDTHAHFVPPAWRKLCEETGHDQPDGMPAIPVSYTENQPLIELEASMTADMMSAMD